MKKATKQEKPLVSVIMPVYNAGNFLVPAIESILKQTYQTFEFIIVDDASDDTSPAILAKYAKRFPKKIRLITLKRNLNRGGDSCANKALSFARGKYIARMDADDIAHPKRLEKQVAFLETHPEIVLVGSNAYVINKEGKRIGIKSEPLTSDAIYKSYMTFHPLIHPTTMVRRIIGKKIFRYKIKYNANNDYYTFFSMLCQGYQFANMKEKLLYYRIHGKNDTFVNMKGKFMNTLRIRLEMLFSYGYKPSIKGITTTAAQTVIIFLLPEKVIPQIYFLTKGIKKLSLPSLSFIHPRKLRFLLPKVVTT